MSGLTQHLRGLGFNFLCACNMDMLLLLDKMVISSMMEPSPSLFWKQEVASPRWGPGMLSTDAPCRPG